MSDDEDETLNEVRPSKPEGQVTLTQMLKALDKDVAVGIERKLKKLSKKKAIEKPLDDHKAAQLERIEGYAQVSKEISNWDPIVERHKHAKNLKFPLDIEPDHLPLTADAIDGIKARNDLEREVQEIINQNKAALAKERELTKAEEKYQKAISADEAKDRHKELQKMRVKLSTYAAKMRRQKGIKSKSYHRLLKQERIKKHLKRVESNQDALLDEIEKLQRMRAQERASLKHKNTGKWAKHAKFRAKYDDDARMAMLEQIGIAGKLLEKPALPGSDSEDEEDFGDGNDTDDSDDISAHSDVSDEEAEEESGVQEEEEEEDNQKDLNGTVADRLIVSSELIDDRAKRVKRRASVGCDEYGDATGDDEGDESEDEEDQQRKLMGEAFANDDVVDEFKRAKDKLVGEEQPKDIDTYLPGWGDWTGPGIRVSKRKRDKFIIKAKKVKRQDATLGNVIISEKANDVIKEFQPKQLPRGFRSDKHLRETLSKPVTATFVNQATHRQRIKPQVETRMGHRIEPINKRMLSGGVKADWA